MLFRSQQSDASDHSRPFRNMNDDVDTVPIPRTESSSSESAPLEKHRTVPTWPESPRPLAEVGYLSVLSCFGDAIVILTSTIFVVYGSFIVHYDGAPLSNVSQLSILQDASSYVSDLIFLFPHYKSSRNCS